MIGGGLKKFARERGLALDKGCAYGVFRGYMTTLDEGMGYKALRTGVHFGDGEQKQRIMDWLGARAKAYKLQGFAPRAGAVEILFVDTTTRGTLKRMGSFMDEFYALLAQEAVEGAGTCPYCGQALSPAESSLASVDGAVQNLHEACLRRLESDLASADAPAAGPEQKPQSVAKGVLGAVLGGIVGAIPWGLVYALGYFVAWLGLLIGICIKKGYELAGGKNGVAKMVVVLLLVLPAMILGQFLGECFSLAWYILSGEITWLSLGDVPVAIYVILMEDSEYRTSVIGNIVMGTVFALLGVIDVFRSLKAEAKGNAGRVRRMGPAPYAGAVPAHGSDSSRYAGPEL